MTTETKVSRVRNATMDTTVRTRRTLLGYMAASGALALGAALWSPVLLVPLGLAGLLGVFEARTLVRAVASLEAERERLREAVTRFGDALGATHDADVLLRVVVETAVEATGASGATVVFDDRKLVEAGDPGAGTETLEVPLTAGRSSFGVLRLTGAAFGAEARMTAASLVAQAVVALENARLHRIVERQALVDGLTGLANRRECERALVAELARAARYGESVALVIADLDGFKGVNDRFGHLAGDAVLRAFAKVLRENVRGGDLAGRWGGEEFVVILPATGVDGGVRLAERVAREVRELAIAASDGTPLPATASFGVAAFPESAADEGELLAAADAALYVAKRAGKNRVERAPLVATLVG